MYQEYSSYFLKRRMKGIRVSVLNKSGHKSLRYVEESSEKGVKGTALILGYEYKTAAYTKNKTLEQKAQKAYYSDDESREEDDEYSWEEMEEEMEEEQAVVVGRRESKRIQYAVGSNKRSYFVAALFRSMPILDSFVILGFRKNIL